MLIVLGPGKPACPRQPRSAAAYLLELPCIAWRKGKPVPHPRSLAHATSTTSKERSQQRSGALSLQEVRAMPREACPVFRC